MRATLIVLAAALSPLCVSHAHAREVETKIMTVFCRAAADIDQYVRYIVAGDDVAAIGFYEAKNQESTPGIGSACWRDRPGTYTLSDRTMGTVAPLECLRASGFTRCYWTLGVSHMPYNK